MIQNPSQNRTCLTDLFVYKSLIIKLLNRLGHQSISINMFFNKELIVKKEKTKSASKCIAAMSCMWKLC